MQILNKVQQHNLYVYLKSYLGNPNACLINITLTFSRENRLKLREVDNGFLKAYNRFMMKLAKANKCHCFGYFAMESLSFSMRKNDLVGEHCHILALCLFDNLAPIFSQMIIKDLWPYSESKHTWVQQWDGNKKLIEYNYGLTQDHAHNVVPTRVYHPRRRTCQIGTCKTCKGFPNPEDLL